MASPRALARRIFDRFGLALVNKRTHYAEDGLYSVHNHDFLADPQFQEAYARAVRANGGRDPGMRWRIHIALWAASTALRVPGDFVECGVNSGVVSSAVMKYVNFFSHARKYYLIDTFSGPILDQYSADENRDGMSGRARRLLDAGAYVTDVESVRANFAEWPNAVVVQGAVPAALARVPSAQIAFLHLDMNCAMPERAALEGLWPRIPRGGIVLLDDYAYWGHGHQKRAIDEAARALGIDVLSLPTGQGLLMA
jgi:hypothetical protein